MPDNNGKITPSAHQRCLFAVNCVMTTKKMRAAWWWPMFRNALIFDTVDLINAYIRENRANVSMMSLDGTVIRAS